MPYPASGVISPSARSTCFRISRGRASRPASWQTVCSTRRASRVFREQHSAVSAKGTFASPTQTRFPTSNRRSCGSNGRSGTKAYRRHSASLYGAAGTVQDMPWTAEFRRKRFLSRRLTSPRRTIFPPPAGSPKRNLKGKALDPPPLLVQLDSRRTVALFDYGAIVFFNFDSPERATLVERLMPFAQRPNKTVSEDDFTLYVGTNPKDPEGMDELNVKELTRDIALLVGAVLSRSVSVEYYEKLVEDALAQLEGPIWSLQSRGTIRHRE